MTTQPSSPEPATTLRSRNLFGTLTTPPNTPFTGHPDEQNKLIEVLRASCPPLTHLIVQQEKHKDGKNGGNIHYHFLARAKTAMRQSKLRSVREALEKFKTGRHDVQFANSVDKVERYLYKDFETHAPYTEGYTDERLAELERSALSEEKEPVMTANPNFFEKQLIEEVSEFLETHHYKVNVYTRQVHGRDGKEKRSVEEKVFYKELADHTTIPKNYGMRGLELIAKHIADPKSYAFPSYTPNSDFIGFNNAMYCFTEGISYALDDPIVEHIAPIRHFDIDFPPPAPTSYLFLIKNHKWDRKGFMAKYGAMFKPKKHRDPCMYLWGPPLTGKSMFYIPLIEVLGDLVGNFTKDGKFSLSQLPDKLVAVLDEVDIWDDNDLSMGLVKKLLEGTEFTVARKNRPPGVVHPIHSFIATNTQPPAYSNDGGKRDYHIEAVLSRIHPYETRDLEWRDEDIIRCVAKDEAPGWAVYCTQTQPYIITPPEYE